MFKTSEAAKEWKDRQKAISQIVLCMMLNYGKEHFNMV